jgi:hypothetical protein
MTFNAFWASGSILFSTIAVMISCEHTERAKKFPISTQPTTSMTYIPGFPVRENTRSTLHCILLCIQHRFHSLSCMHIASPIDLPVDGKHQGTPQEANGTNYRYLDN